MRINIGYLCEHPIYIELPDNLTSEEVAIRLDLLKEIKTLTVEISDER